MSLPDFLRVYRSTPHTVTGRSQLFGGREMRGKIPQFSLGSEDSPEVRQKDALAKQKMKIYADKKAYAKPPQIREGDTVLLQQEKKNKLSTPFEGISYTVSGKISFFRCFPFGVVRSPRRLFFRLNHFRIFKKDVPIQLSDLSQLDALRALARASHRSNKSGVVCVLNTINSNKRIRIFSAEIFTIQVA